MKPLVLDDFKRPNSKSTKDKLAALVRVNSIQMTQAVKAAEKDAEVSEASK